MAIEPVTREERFLAAAGGRSVTAPTPITRKEQLLQGIIDAVKSGGATPDVIEGAVNDYLNANPVKPGATTEQAAQIEQNKNDIADLQTEVDEKQPKGDYVKTVNGNKPDASGNVVVATGGNGSGENATGLTTETKNLILTLFQNAVFTSDQSANIQALYNLFFTPSGEIEVTGITLSHSELTFEAMAPRNLVATLAPNGAAGTIVWASSNESVATVSQLGAVTPVGNGKCVITASVNDYSASCNITVNVSVRVNITQEGSMLTIIDTPNVTQDGAVLTIW